MSITRAHHGPGFPYHGSRIPAGLPADRLTELRERYRRFLARPESSAPPRPYSEAVLAEIDRALSAGVGFRTIGGR